MEDCEEDGCKEAAKENQARNRGEPKQWFQHKADFREGQQPHRIRPEGREFIEKSEVRVSTACLAGFADRPKTAPNADSVCMETTRAQRRLRTEEAEANANKFNNQQEKWFDFEGNKRFHPKQKPFRIGASEAAREFMLLQKRGTDWFNHTATRPTANSNGVHRRLRPGTAANLRTSDWFSHTALPPDNSKSRFSFERHRTAGEGIEYALRNRGDRDLIRHREHSTDSTEQHASFYRCPSRESRRNCSRIIGSQSMAACLWNRNMERAQTSARTRTSNEDLPSVNGDEENSRKPPKVHGEEAEEWRLRGVSGSMGRNMFTGTKQNLCPASTNRVRAEASKLRERLSSDSQLRRCISYDSGHGPLTPIRQSKMVSCEAEDTYLKNRDGQMRHIIGNAAESTILNHSSKSQPRCVVSETAREIQAKSAGGAARELLCNTSLTEPRPAAGRGLTVEARNSANFNQLGSIGDLLGGHQRGLVKYSPRKHSIRVTTAEGKDYAERQRDGSTMRGLLTFGAG